MTQLEKSQKLADLQAKMQILEDERRALEATPVTTYKVWEPQWNDTFFPSHFIEWRNLNTDYEKEWVKTGIAHPTKEAAERHHSFLVMLHDLHKFAVTENEGWKPDFSTRELKFMIYRNCEQLEVNSNREYNYSILPYFNSRDIAQKAIDTFGDRLKILFEYYNS